MCALALTQVPDSDVAPSVCTDEFTLVGMYDNVVDRMAVAVITLYHTRTSVPNSYTLVL